MLDWMNLSPQTTSLIGWILIGVAVLILLATLWYVLKTRPKIKAEEQKLDEIKKAEEKIEDIKKQEVVQKFQDAKVDNLKKGAGKTVVKQKTKQTQIVVATKPPKAPKALKKQKPVETDELKPILETTISRLEEKNNPVKKTTVKTKKTTVVVTKVEKKKVNNKKTS